MAEAVRQAEDSGADDVPEPGVEGGEDKAGSLKRAETAERENRERMTEEQLVEYEGTLVTATAAQRRKLFSALLQRAAKMNRKLGGGSMTLIPVLRGTPATGQAKGLKARRAIEQMSTLVSGVGRE